MVFVKLLSLHKDGCPIVSAKLHLTDREQLAVTFDHGGARRTGARSADAELSRVRIELPPLMTQVAKLRVPLAVEVGVGANCNQAHQTVRAIKASSSGPPAACLGFRRDGHPD